MAQRIKGQEVSLRIFINNVEQVSMVDVRSFELSAQLELKTEGYLGETTNRRDEIYNGVRGRMELHFEDAGVFTFMRSVIDRARRRTPGTRIDANATLSFPSGQKARVNFPDIFFGEIPTNFSSRSDYGAITVDFEAQDFSVI